MESSITVNLCQSDILMLQTSQQTSVGIGLQMCIKYGYYFNIKMLKGLQRSMYSNSTKATNVLKELEQNQNLRIQVYKAKISLRDQQQRFLNSTINQQMLAENIMTQLTMVLRRFKQALKDNDNQQTYSLARTIEKCIEDMGCLMEYYNTIRLECGQGELGNKDDSGFYDEIIQSCSLKLNQAQSIIEVTRGESQGKAKEMQRLKQDFQRVKRQLNQSFSLYQRSLSDNAIIKEEIHKITEQKQSIQQLCKKYHSELDEARNYNDHLSQQLKQSREVSSKHLDYIKRKEREIQEENSKLIEINHEFMIKEAEMTKTINQKQQEIKKLHQVNRQLQDKLHQFEGTFQEIIDKENKIKILQEQRRKGEQRLPLQQTYINKQQTYINKHIQPSVSTTITHKKQVGKVTKRFNLHSFQEKLTNSTNNFYPH